ncbi:MAG: DUF7504 family protein [Thermoplasmata archaeon]
MGYLALDPEETVSSFLRALAQARTRFLWMTSTRTASAPAGGDLLRVTTVHRGIGTVDPRRLQDLRAAATTFFDEYGPGAIVVDCLEPLVLHAGVERALRFVHDLHEETAMRSAFLVVFARPREMNRRMIAWLERELDPLPRVGEPADVEDRLVV